MPNQQQNKNITQLKVVTSQLCFARF